MSLLYHKLRAPNYFLCIHEVSGCGCGRQMPNGSHSKMKLSSGFWSYTVETEAEVHERKASTGIPEDPRTKDLSKPDH